MNPAQLLAHFDRMADAPDAIPRLRRFVLDLAVRGRLTGEAKWSNYVEPLGNVAKLQNGYAFKSEWFAREGIRLLRNANVGHGDVRWDEVVHLPEGRAEEFERFRLSEGDVVLSLDRPIIVTGTKVARIRDDDLPCLLLQRVGRFQLDTDRVSAEYLYLWLNSPPFTAQINPGRSNGVPHISSKQVEAAQIAVPPLAEQRRIVEKVDELMALCERLEVAQAEREGRRDRLVRASLTRLNQPDGDSAAFRDHARFTLDHLPRLTTRPEHVAQLRQTILNLAVRGKLVPQDPNDEPALELLKQIQVEKRRAGGRASASQVIEPLDQTEIPFDAPPGWGWSRLGDMCSKTGSGSTPRGGQAAYRDTGIPFLRSQNVHDDALRLDDVAYIDLETHGRMGGTVVRPADLLLNITGGSMGRCCRVPDDFTEANVSQHVAIIRVAVRGTEDFLHRVILSPFFQAYVFDEQTGAGRGGLPKNRMDRIPVPLPPLAEQLRIAARVDELMAVCDQLDAHLTAAQTDRGRLLDAVLHAALHAG